MAKPLISIVIEFYNEEVNALTLHTDTLKGLYQQDFPLDQIELVLIGSHKQMEELRSRYSDWPGLAGVQIVTASPDKSHYYSLKNEAARCARADYVAFADSDVLPESRWLATIVRGFENGADCVVGPSQFRKPGLDPYSPWMLAAALPSWGFVLAPTPSAQLFRANSLLSHNFAIRRDLMLRYPFASLQRSFLSSILFFDLKRSGAKVAYQPEQRVAHGMTFRWWLRFHFRRGWETYIGRGLDKDWPRIPVIHRLRFIEPPVLRMALVCRDARHWFRYSKALALTKGRAAAMFPLVVAFSFVARVFEMAGMYAALLIPRATEHQARF